MTGGWDGKNQLVSTEVISSVSGGWKYVGELPSKRWILRGITLANKIFVSGYLSPETSENKLFILGGVTGCGNQFADILQFNPTSNQWEEAGQMKKGREGHAVSLIPLDQAQKLCL